MNLQDIRNGQKTFNAILRLYSRLTLHVLVCTETSYETDDKGTIITLTGWNASPGKQITFSCTLQLCLEEGKLETLIHFSVSKKRGAKSTDLVCLTRSSSTNGWTNDINPEERIMNAVRGTTPRMDDREAFAVIEAAIIKYRA